MSYLQFANSPAATEDPNTPRWYAVRTRSRFEVTTSLALRDKGLIHFLPTYRSKRQWSDRIKELDLPLFPGYVFCRFCASEPWPVLNSPGVVHIVSAGSRPIPVDDREIESVRTVCNADVKASPSPAIAPGQRLVIVRGPLKGAEGTLVRAKDHSRLVVSISLLQRAIAAELEWDWIAAEC